MQIINGVATWDVGDIVHEIDVDFHNKAQFKTVPLHQYDYNSTYILATVWDNSNVYTIPAGAIVTFSATKPDGKGLDNPCKVVNNQIIYQVTEQTTTKDGDFYAEFRIYDTVTNVDLTTTPRLKGSPTFKIYVEKSALSNDTVISTDEFNVLTNLINDTQTTITDMNTVKDATITATTNANNATATITQTNTTVNTAEQTRIANENERIANEELRPDYKYVTQAEYDALPQADKDNPKYIYEITDDDGEFPTNLQTLINDVTTAKNNYDASVSSGSDLEVVEARTSGVTGVTSSTLKNRLDLVDGQLTTIENYITYAEQFGIKSSNENNHDQIIIALNALQENGGGTLLLPTGIKTSPISFQGYNNITLKGITTSLPWSIPATIKIIGDNPVGSIGLQFSDSLSGDSRPTWEAKFCKLENMYIDCDHKCDYGVNGNLGLEMHDVCIRYARLDGIVCENWSYPLFFNKVYSQYNTRHGIYIKGGMTTCYSIEKSEFNYNGGLGLLIEGGARASFKDCFAQGNAQGGYTINYKSGIVGSYYLENIHIDIYTEANGTLLDTDTNYTGNYQCIITGYDKTNNSLYKPKRLEIKGALNAISGSKALKVDSVFGCKISAPVSGTVNITNGGVLGLEFTTSPSISAIPSIGSAFATTSYMTTYNGSTSLAGTIYNGLWYPKRGKTEKLIFKLDSISAGSTVLMKTVYDTVSNIGEGYKAFKDGSIVGIGLYKGNVNGTVAGTLTIRPVRTSSSYSLAIDPSLQFTSFVDLVATSSQFDCSSEYNPVAFPFSKNDILGLQIVASSDYQAGYNTSLIGYIIIEN